MIGLLAKYQYVKNGNDFHALLVGEYWSGTDDIGGWLDRVEQFHRNQFSAHSTFPCATAEGLCDTPSYDLPQPHRRRLGGDEAAAPRRDLRRQPRMGDNTIVNDKLMATPSSWCTRATLRLLVRLYSLKEDGEREIVLKFPGDLREQAHRQDRSASELKNKF